MLREGTSQMARLDRCPVKNVPALAQSLRALIIGRKTGETHQSTGCILNPPAHNQAWQLSLFSRITMHATELKGLGSKQLARPTSEQGLRGAGRKAWAAALVSMS